MFKVNKYSNCFPYSAKKSVAGALLQKLSDSFAGNVCAYINSLAKTLGEKRRQG